MGSMFIRHLCQFLCTWLAWAWEINLYTVALQCVACLLLLLLVGRYFTLTVFRKCNPYSPFLRWNFNYHSFLLLCRFLLPSIYFLKRFIVSIHIIFIVHFMVKSKETQKIKEINTNVHMHILLVSTTNLGSKCSLLLQPILLSHCCLLSNYDCLTHCWWPVSAVVSQKQEDTSLVTLPTPSTTMVSSSSWLNTPDPGSRQ